MISSRPLIVENVGGRRENEERHDLVFAASLAYPNFGRSHGGGAPVCPISFESKLLANACAAKATRLEAESDPCTAYGVSAVLACQAPHNAHDVRDALSAFAFSIDKYIRTAASCLS